MSGHNDAPGGRDHKADFMQKDKYSTEGINQQIGRHPQVTREFMEQFWNEYSLQDILDVIESLKDLKVAVIGDTIIDEYRYCDTLGVSSKDPVMALQYQSEDKFAGGILSIANHVANFAGSVDIFTTIGEENDHLDFIKEKLNPSIQFNYYVQKGAPTVLKRRYIEGYTRNKLIEIYFMDMKGLDPATEDRMCQRLEKELPDYDLVLVADFGHGAISNRTREVIQEHAPYLAVNAQANAGNRGFHTISKYTNMDFACIAEHEARLEMRDSTGPILPLLDNLRSRVESEKFIITRGSNGCLLFDSDGNSEPVPALAGKVVDRIGAGDAFLSLASMVARQGISLKMIGIVGNVVGSLAVAILGNQKSITKEGLVQAFQDLAGESATKCNE